MQVFIFDWTAYAENVDKFKIDGEVPRLVGEHFEPEVAVNTYANHLAAWEELERQGFDGVAINEHHGTPFGMGASPNLLAAALSQRTERLKILVYANLLPIHEPLRLAEEIAMLDCMTNGRLLCGVGRGAPREYKIFNVPMSESRSRFTEAFEVMRRAWTDDRLSFQGEHFSFDDVSIWPRTVQKPHPPIWIPLTGSKESIEWAAEQDAAITPGVFPGPMREDTIRYFAECQRKHGRKVDPNKISIMVDCYVADSKEQAIDEYGEHLMYLFNTLLRYDQVWQSDVKKTKYYSSTAFEHLREGAKGTLAEDDTVFNEWTIETVRDAAQHMPIGTADEVVERILAECDDAGANNVLLVCNRGDMPHHMYMNQIRRIGEEVLPRLQAHNVTVVPHAEQREAAE
ncbi:Alkanal monooxygenase alpha chain [Croceibacterium atlanticum]|uniref:Alkanal monooxygenase alpha chain n=1 Tax=Croceibacterium atlanticum TaxID=1267766 RepID=A0A0F7KRL4_9SPHN|nr:Alkanal monooxygenase alpha chain [Croceibacterium atlanticum]